MLSTPHDHPVLTKRFSVNRRHSRAVVLVLEVVGVDSDETAAAALLEARPLSELTARVGLAAVAARKRMDAKCFIVHTVDEIVSLYS